MSNLASLGININLNDLTVEEAYYIEYFGMMRKNIEEKTRFETLIQILKGIFGK